MIAYKLNADGSLSHKAVLNNAEELNNRSWNSKFDQIIIQSESTGSVKVYKRKQNGAYIEVE